MVAQGADASIISQVAVEQDQFGSPGSAFRAEQKKKRIEIQVEIEPESSGTTLGDPASSCGLQRNLGPLGEQEMLLTPEPSFQP